MTSITSARAAIHSATRNAYADTHPLLDRLAGVSRRPRAHCPAASGTATAGSGADRSETRHGFAELPDRIEDHGVRVAARRAVERAIGTEEGELWPFERVTKFRPPGDLRG